MEDAYALVRRAIGERRQIHATYTGHQRRMCPHVLGLKDGQPRALFFQFGGGSGRGLPPEGDWRCLPLGGLTDVSIQDGPWHTRAHCEPQRCIDDVDLAIEG